MRLTPCCRRPVAPEHNAQLTRREDCWLHGSRRRWRRDNVGAPHKYQRAFLERVSQEWLTAAPAAAARIHFTGRIEHDDLPNLLPVCEAQVMPSTFPEAFGMVAVEAAACGALPLSARHSGMAEVTAALAPALPDELRSLLSFEVGPGAVEEIAGKLVAWLTLAVPERERARTALATEAARRYSWEAVAKGVIAAAQGRLTEIPNAVSSANNLRVL